MGGWLRRPRRPGASAARRGGGELGDGRVLADVEAVAGQAATLQRPDSEVLRTDAEAGQQLGHSGISR